MTRGAKSTKASSAYTDPNTQTRNEDVTFAAKKMFQMVGGIDDRCRTYEDCLRFVLSDRELMTRLAGMEEDSDSRFHLCE